MPRFERKARFAVSITCMESVVGWYPSPTSGTNFAALINAD